MKRREAQSSALSFMDCICCGFGAVLLLFILTAKSQILQNSENTRQSLETARTLEAAIETAQAKRKALDKGLSALEPQTEITSVAEIAAKRERLAKAIEEQAQALAALKTKETSTKEPASLNRPSADQNYLSGLSLHGPRALILLENSGSMLAENSEKALQLIQSGQKKSDKWERAKAAVRAVIAAIPKGTQVALYQMNQTATALSGSPQNPYFDPYDHIALIDALERLDKLEPTGGADLGKALQTVNALHDRPSSLLLIGDGLPTAPAPQGQGPLSEATRVMLFKRATAAHPVYPFNTILLPFKGDPSAAGLFWRLSTHTGGVTLIPHENWPAL